MTEKSESLGQNPTTCKCSSQGPRRVILSQALWLPLVQRQDQMGTLGKTELKSMAGAARGKLQGQGFQYSPFQMSHLHSN